MPTATEAERLARILGAVRMRSIFTSRALLTAPWSLTVPGIAEVLAFHVPLSGIAWLTLPGEAPRRLEPGHLALVPHGRGHLLADRESAASGLPVELLPQEYRGPHYSELIHGGDGEPAELLCGLVGFDDPAAAELLRQLPQSLIIDTEHPDARGAARDTLRMISAEMSHPSPGSEIIATRLADVLVIETIRTWLADRDRSSSGWLQALGDERIGRALEAIHAEPERAWTVSELAREAMMSRSTFSARFSELLGDSPMAHLTRWRIQVARTMLAEGSSPAQTAAAVGYGSAAAFHRAFARLTGTTPGAVSRTGQEPISSALLNRPDAS